MGRGGRDKRTLEAQLAGRDPEKQTNALLLSQAIETFEANKQAQGIKVRVLNMYKRELKRLLTSLRRGASSRWRKLSRLTTSSRSALRGPPFIRPHIAGPLCRGILTTSSASATTPPG